MSAHALPTSISRPPPCNSHFAWCQLRVTILDRFHCNKFLVPNALNVKVKKLNQARVNDGSNYGLAFSKQQHYKCGLVLHWSQKLKCQFLYTSTKPVAHSKLLHNSEIMIHWMATELQISFCKCSSMHVFMWSRGIQIQDCLEKGAELYQCLGKNFCLRRAYLLEEGAWCMLTCTVWGCLRGEASPAGPPPLFLDEILIVTVGTGVIVNFLLVIFEISYRSWWI